MKIKHIPPVCVLVFAAMAFNATDVRAQVDPAWLNSWNEAQKDRPATMTSRGRIAAENEPGVPLVIHGRVFRPDGTAAGGVVVHAYHRDSDGFDFGRNDNSLNTWRLQGWAKTDAEGRFEFQTIRPAPDQLGREAAHMHFTLESVDFGRQWAPKVFFADDRLVTAIQRRRSEKAGEFSWVQKPGTVEGVEHIDVRFRLKEKADF